MTFSLYSPRGLVLVGAFGQTTTSQYGRNRVGVAASSAACTVLYCLVGPTSAISGLVAVIPASSGKLAPSTCTVKPFTLVFPLCPVISRTAAPSGNNAGTVNVMLLSVQLVTAIAVPLSVSLSGAPDAPKPNPVTVIDRFVSRRRMYGLLTDSSCGTAAPRSQIVGLTVVVSGARTVAATWVGASSVTV